MEFNDNRFSLASLTQQIIIVLISSILAFESGCFLFMKILLLQVPLLQINYLVSSQRGNKYIVALIASVQIIV